MNYSKILLIGFLSITLVGCGADSKSAFRTISNYAGHGKTAPTVDDLMMQGLKVLTPEI